MDIGFFFVKRVGQFNYGPRGPLQFPHILAPLADDSAHLRRRNYEFNSEAHLIRPGKQTFLSHLFKYEVLSLKKETIIDSHSSKKRLWFGN